MMKKSAMKMLGVLAVMVMFVAGTMNVSGSVVFTEDWSSPDANWVFAGDDGNPEATTAFAVRVTNEDAVEGGGDTDPALFIGNVALNWSTSARNTTGYARADQVACQFICFGADTVSNFTQIFPNASGIHGPWHDADSGAAIYNTSVATFDKWHNDLKESENNMVQAGVAFSGAFQDKFAAAVDRANAIAMRITLDPVAGAHWEYHDGSSWATLNDTRGTGADTTATAYLGFGPAQGGVFIDDITVVTNAVPVEISAYKID